jgi:DNA invertase Pin-like site-specific DNA recombinase
MIAMMDRTNERGAPTEKRVKAVAYVRVSTEEQADSGLGLEAQRSAIRCAEDRLGLEVVDWFADEGVSGGKIDGRFGLIEAIDAVKRGFVLVVARRDRLARDAMLACWIEKEIAKRRGRIVSVAGEGTDNDDPTSVLMRRIIDAFAEYERLLIGVRTKAALRVKVRRGERVGRHAFYGFQLDENGVQVADAHEKEGIRLMVELRRKGMSFARIAADVEARGFLGRKSQRLSPKIVRDIIRREAIR